MHVLFLRHADWDYVPNGRDRGINELGRAEAKKLSSSLGRFDAILVSRYLRARETGLIITDRWVETDQRLDEIEFPYDFPTAAEYTRAVFEQELVAVMRRVESLEESLGGLVKDLLDEYGPSARILCVSHRVLMIAFLVKLIKGEIKAADWADVDFENLTGFELEVEANGTIKEIKLFPSS